MEHSALETPDITAKNIDKLLELFPSVVIEGENGKKGIDFNKLKSELSGNIIEDAERYEFTWIGKKASILEANRPIHKVLIPDRESSVDWENTQNIYIEGDNIDALKLLQSSYLGKIKMIYIDPPYNTGKDFIYKDNFTLKFNTNNSDKESRRHSGWCSMIYPRLMLARNLLSDDGVIFISIDDNEVSNLKNICDEIFGTNNLESIISWRRRNNQPNDATKMIATVSEYIFVYSKNSAVLKKNKTFYTLPISTERLDNYANPDNDLMGDWSSTPWCASRGQGGSRYEIITPTGAKYLETWLGTKETFERLLKEKRIIFPNNGNGKPRKKIYKTERINKGQAAINFWVGNQYGDNLSATAELKVLLGEDRYFDYPKPINLLKTVIKLTTNENNVILDFFSGSATTAHACMQLNAEDGGHRKFIMVQLPEITNKNSEAYKAGYKNICEIGKERIRRAGKKIKEANPDKDLDIGFRVYRISDLPPASI